jgi:hypothetical protein
MTELWVGRCAQHTCTSCSPSSPSVHCGATAYTFCLTARTFAGGYKCRKDMMGIHEGYADAQPQMVRKESVSGLDRIELKDF